MMTGGTTEMHQRGFRRPDSPIDDTGKLHPRPRRPSVAIFQNASAVTFAAVGVVLLLLLIGAVVMISDSRGNRYEHDERTSLVPGKKTYKIAEEALKRKLSEESAEEYAQRVRERYVNRIAKLREEEMRKIAEDEAKNQAEEDAKNQAAELEVPVPVPEQIVAQQAAPPQQQQQPAEPPQQQQQQAPSVENPPQPPQASQVSLEESLRAIHEQLARLQQGFQQKQVEEQTSPPPSLSPQETQRQAELQELIRKMNELRAQSAALESMIEEAKNQK